MEDKTVIKNLKYEFTDAEDRQNAKELARQNQALVEAELKKKQVTADLKADAERIASTIAKLSRWVNDGYDFREVNCKIVFNDPKAGIKSLYRIDTGELVESLSMEEWEKQGKLPLGGSNDPEPEEEDDEEEFDEDEEPSGDRRPY